MTLTERIHNEIDTAVVNTSCVSQEIEEMIEKQVQKVNRLKKLGFTNCQEVTESETKIMEYNNQKELKKLADYYLENYPFNKFLTVDMFEKILEKYDLIYAPVKNYIKNISEKNLKEIEDRKPLGEYKQLDVFTFTGDPSLFTWLKTVFGTTTPDRSQIREKVKKIYSDDHPNGWDDPDISLTTGFHVIEAKIRGNRSYRTVSQTQKTGLFIAAPKSHFDLEGLQQDKKGFFNFTKFEPKDPIVFEFCEGGVLIRSKWGEEAEDVDLVIPVLN